MNKTVIRNAETLLAQIPTEIPRAYNLPVRTQPQMKAQAVIFDLFGTLIRTHDVAAQEHFYCVKKAADTLGINMSETVAQDILQQYRSCLSVLKEHSRQLAGGHGEITIADAWEQAFAKISIPISRPQAEEFAFLYSLCATSPHPMPGMQELISRLHRQGIPLGIISNAQPFTMRIVNYFLDGTCEDYTYQRLFDTEICCFSFQQKLVKPDARLFKKVTRALGSRGIEPAECLYVGNDMYRDIFPAQKAGFRTALFVGDSASLRLRSDHKSVAELRSDYIIAELNQIDNCITVN